MVNRKHITLKKQVRQYDLHSDLVDTEIAICSKALMQHLNDDIEMRQLKEDFIINLNMSELTDDQVQAYIIPSGSYYGQVLDPRTY